MISVRSFVKVKKKFVPLDRFEGPPPDNNYIEGAISLEIDGVELFGLDLWDDLNHLWCYLVDGLVDVMAGKDVKTGFPDQPIDVIMRPIGSRVVIEVYGKRATAEREDLIREMSQAALDFLTFAERYNPGQYQDALEKLRSLRTS